MLSHKNQSLLSVVLIVMSVLLACLLFATQSVKAQSSDGLFVSGSADFIKNGKKYDSFRFEINCTLTGLCDGSRLIFENDTHTIPAQGLFAGSTKDYTLFVMTSKEQNLECNVWHFGPITSGPTNDLYFDCISSQNSAVSSNAIMKIP